jgi:glycosyltransferase involved in cell wall biosynthesis
MDDTLTKGMKRIFQCLNDLQGQGFYRSDQPALRCKDILAREGIDLQIAWRFDGDQHWDAFCLNKVPTPEFCPVIEELKRRGCKIVWNVDDFLPSCPNYNWFSQHLTKDFFERWEFIKDKADLIVASTETLLHEIGCPEKSCVARNAVNLDYMKPLLPDPSWVTIVWAGGDNHSADLEILNKVIPPIIGKYKNVRVEMFGMMPADLYHYSHARQMNFRGIVPFDKYFEVLAQLRGDIGLAPLVYNRFNSCRSNLKFLEYSAMGMTTVATHIQPYYSIAQDYDGLLCYDVEEWISALELLIEDSDSRKEMARNARQSILDSYCWQSQEVLDEWCGVFRSIV